MVTALDTSTAAVGVVVAELQALAKTAINTSKNKWRMIFIFVSRADKMMSNQRVAHHFHDWAASNLWRRSIGTLVDQEAILVVEVYRCLVDNTNDLFITAGGSADP